MGISSVRMISMFAPAGMFVEPGPNYQPPHVDQQLDEYGNPIQYGQKTFDTRDQGIPAPSGMQDMFQPGPGAINPDDFMRQQFDKMNNDLNGIQNPGSSASLNNAPGSASQDSSSANNAGSPDESGGGSDA